MHRLPRSRLGRYLQKQHGFDTHTVSLVLIVANIGAIVGGLFFGYLSERIGRVNAITIASLLALPAIPLWAHSSTARPSPPNRPGTATAMRWP